MKIAIDIGHNCPPDTGAKGINIEDNCTRQIGYLIISRLNMLGHEAILVTPSSASTVVDSLSKRVSKANNSNVDLYAAIHMNAFDGSAKGTEVFYYNGSVKGKEYAQKVLVELVKLGYYNRGIKDGSGLYVVKNAKAPAILVECCFCDNKEDMDRYNADDIANAIVKGITGQTVSAKNDKIYKVQIGAFKEKSNAEALLKDLKNKGYTGFIV